MMEHISESLRPMLMNRLIDLMERRVETLQEENQKPIFPDYVNIGEFLTGAGMEVTGDELLPNGNRTVSFSEKEEENTGHDFDDPIDVMGKSFFDRVFEPYKMSVLGNQLCAPQYVPNHLNDIQKRQNLRGVAMHYHRLCELYDKRICSNIHPVTKLAMCKDGVERTMVERNASIQFAKSIQIGREFGLAPSEVQKAIHEYAGEFEREVMMNDNTQFLSFLQRSQFEVIEQWLDQPDYICPLVIHGLPSTGKTVLATALARLLSDKPLTGLFDDKLDPMWLATRKGGFDVALIDAMRLTPIQTKAVWINAIGLDGWQVSSDEFKEETILPIRPALPLIITSYTKAVLGPSYNDSKSMFNVSRLKPLEIRMFLPSHPMDDEAAVMSMMEYLQQQLGGSLDTFKAWHDLGIYNGV